MATTVAALTAAMVIVWCSRRFRNEASTTTTAESIQTPRLVTCSSSFPSAFVKRLLTVLTETFSACAIWSFV